VADANGTRIVCELNHMMHFTSAGSTSTSNVRIATKRLATRSLSNSAVKSLLGAGVGLLNDGKAIDYLLIANAGDGHSALEILRANQHLEPSSDPSTRKRLGL
jgi:hypothetical protein